MVCLLATVACSKPASGHDVQFPASSVAFSLSEDLARLEFLTERTEVRSTQTVWPDHVGREGVVLPAGCAFRLRVPRTGQLRVSLGLHTRDWAESLAGRIGHPKVTALLGKGEGARELFSVDFARHSE